MTRDEPQGAPHPTVLREFLLGLSSPDDRERIEDEVLAQSDLFDQLVATEDDLIDDYALDRLSVADRARFEEHFASGGGEARHQRLRERVAFARDLSTLAPRPATAPTTVATTERRSAFSLGAFLASLLPPMNPVLATAAAALIALCGWLGWQTVALRTELETQQQAVLAGVQEIEQLRAAASTSGSQKVPSHPSRLAEELAEARQQITELESRGEQLAQEAAAARQAMAARTQPRQPPSVVRSASFILSLATSVRGVEAAQRLRIPAGIDHVDLQVDLTGDSHFASYRVALRSIDGDEIWSRAGLALHKESWGNGVELRLPAASLEPGDYELMIFGNTAGQLEELAFIDFRVTSAEP